MGWNFRSFYILAETVDHLKGDKDIRIVFSTHNLQAKKGTEIALNYKVLNHKRVENAHIKLYIYIYI